MTQEAFGIIVTAVVVIAVSVLAFVGLVYFAVTLALRHDRATHTDTPPAWPNDGAGR